MEKIQGGFWSTVFAIRAVKEYRYQPDHLSNFDGEVTPNIFLAQALTAANNADTPNLAANILMGGRLRRSSQRTVMVQALRHYIDLSVIARDSYKHSPKEIREEMQRYYRPIIMQDRRLLFKTEHPGALARFLDKHF